MQVKKDDDDDGFLVHWVPASRTLRRASNSLPLSKDELVKAPDTIAAAESLSERDSAERKTKEKKKRRKKEKEKKKVPSVPLC